jgi:hypothetical protein
MQSLTAEWVAKAEGDWNSALPELRAGGWGLAVGVKSIFMGEVVA